MTMLRPTLVSLALAALASQAVAADSNVVLYGRVVGGADYQNNVLKENGKSGRLVRAADNQWGTSMLGFKGTEDLGDGLKAIFLLESGFALSQGATNGPAFFNRRAYVGFDTPGWGTLKVGKDLSISNDVYEIDPTGQQFMSTATLVRGRNWQGADNMFEYQTPIWGGFSATVQTSLGEGQTGRKDAISLAFVQPSYQLRAIYDTKPDVARNYTDLYNFSKELIVGGTVSFGNLKALAGYNRITAPDVATGPDKADHYWLGVNYDVTPRLLLIAAAYHVKQNKDAGSATLGMVGANYRLSKRTLLYVSVGHVNNSDETNFSVEATNNNPAFGGGQTGAYTGFAHSF